jgi:hypothetical protein
MPLSSIGDLLTQLRQQYPLPSVNPAPRTAAQISQQPPSPGQNHKALNSYRDFYPNPFNQQGNPSFDPTTGQFLGLDTGDGINQPSPYRPSGVEGTTNASTRAILRNLPSLLAAINAQILPNEISQLQASEITSPRYAAIQQGLQHSNALSAANSDKEILLGPGGDIVNIADKLQRQVDPEFYKTREATSGAINELLKPGLTGGESSAIERSLNRSNNATGNLNNASNTTTVSNALSYGNAARDKLSQAVNQATQFLPASRSGVDVLQQGIKSPSAISQAFGNTRQSAGQEPFGIAGSSLGNISSNQNAFTSGQFGLRGIKAGLPSSAERVLGALPDY